MIPYTATLGSTEASDCPITARQPCSNGVIKAFITVVILLNAPHKSMNNTLGSGIVQPLTATSRFSLVLQALCLAREWNRSVYG